MPGRLVNDRGPTAQIPLPYPATLFPSKHRKRRGGGDQIRALPISGSKSPIQTGCKPFIWLLRIPFCLVIYCSVDSQRWRQTRRNGLLVTSMLMVVIFDMDLEDDITHYISSDNAEGLKSLLSHRDVRNGTYSYCRTTLLQSLCLFSALKCATALVDGKLGIRVDVNRDPAVASLCS